MLSPILSKLDLSPLAELYENPEELSSATRELLSKLPVHLFHYYATHLRTEHTWNNILRYSNLSTINPSDPILWELRVTDALFDNPTASATLLSYALSMAKDPEQAQARLLKASPVYAEADQTDPRCIVLGNMSPVETSNTAEQLMEHLLQWTPLPDRLSLAHMFGLPLVIRALSGSTPDEIESRMAHFEDFDPYNTPYAFFRDPLDIIGYIAQVVKEGYRIPARLLARLLASPYLAKNYPEVKLALVGSVKNTRPLPAPTPYAPHPARTPLPQHDIRAPHLISPKDWHELLANLPWPMNYDALMKCPTWERYLAHLTEAPPDFFLVTPYIDALPPSPHTASVFVERLRNILPDQQREDDFDNCWQATAKTVEANLACYTGTFPPLPDVFLLAEEVNLLRPYYPTFELALRTPLPNLSELFPNLSSHDRARILADHYANRPEVIVHAHGVSLPYTEDEIKALRASLKAKNRPAFPAYPSPPLPF